MNCDSVLVFLRNNVVPTGERRFRIRGIENAFLDIDLLYRDSCFVGLPAETIRDIFGPFGEVQQQRRVVINYESSSPEGNNTGGIGVSVVNDTVLAWDVGLAKAIRSYRYYDPKKAKRRQ